MTELLAGRYSLGLPISRGGMGVVRRARDERLDRDVAVKLLHPWIAEDEDLRRRFAREAQVLAPLEHEHIVRLYDFGDEGETPFLVMELVEGANLNELLSQGRSAWGVTADLGIQIASALAYAHARGIVHRDLTPSNVLIEAVTGRVVVTDFGLARLARSGASLTTRGMLLGTPEYWSPEQARGIDSGTATDMYALGCILFALMAGRPPFEGDDRLAVGLRRAHEDAPALDTLVPGSPPHATELVRALLDRGPEARPSAAEALVALGGTSHLETDTGQAAGERTEPETIRLPAPEATVVLPVPRAHRVRRRRGRKVLAAVALAALAAALAFVGATIANADAVVDVPRVAGLPLVDARAEVARAAHADRPAEAPLEVTGRAYSEKLPKGHVLRQWPAAGTRVERAELLVTVRLSRGTALATVPDITGLERAAAIKALRRLGFRAATRPEESWDVPAGVVIGSDVAAGEQAVRPGPLGVVVSSGRPKADLPDLAGIQADEARERLDDTFEVNVEEAGSDTATPGTVIGQRPAPGRIEVGSAVTLVVARAFEWVEVYRESGSGDFDSEEIEVEVPEGRWRIVYAISPRFFIFGSGRATFSWEGTGAGQVALDEAGTYDVVQPASGAGRYWLRVRPQGNVSWSVRVEALS